MKEKLVLQILMLIILGEKAVIPSKEKSSVPTGSSGPVKKKLVCHFPSLANVRFFHLIRFPQKRDNQEEDIGGYLQRLAFKG